MLLRPNVKQITTSDIMHDECTTPTYRSRDASTPNAEKSYSSTTPIPASDTTITEYEGDADREGDDERERESEKEGEIESAKEAELPLQSFDTATTPTSSVLGVSPGKLLNLNRILCCFYSHFL